MTQYVFDSREVIRYRYPTHTNDLIMDRAQATASRRSSSSSSPARRRRSTSIPTPSRSSSSSRARARWGSGPDAAEKHPLKVGDFVRTPPGVPHSVRCLGDGRFVYLSIDCFVAGPDPAEPTWDCARPPDVRDNGWEFDAVKLGPVATARELSTSADRAPARWRNNDQALRRPRRVAPSRTPTTARSSRPGGSTSPMSGSIPARRSRRTRTSTRTRSTTWPRGPGS